MCSETDHLGGKMTKSAMATPGRADEQVRTVNIDGSCNCKTISFICFLVDVKTTYAMVELDGIDDHEISQIVFVRDVISVPGDYVKRAVLLDGLEEMAAVFVDNFILDAVDVLEPGRRCFEIPRIGQPIGTDGPQIGQLEMRVVNFEDVAAGRAVHIDTKAHPFVKISK